MVRRSWNCELVRGLFLVHAGDSACFEFLAVNTIALTGMGDGVIFAPALPGSWNNLLPVSLVPRPLFPPSTWPGYEANFRCATFGTIAVTSLA